MYKIGQVLYVVLTKKSQVYPMQVVEVITKKTLEGEAVSYILQAGSEKSSRIELSTVDGEIFETAERARKTLVERATSQINKLVETATRKSAEWYGDTPDNEVQTIRDLPDLSVNQFSKDQVEEVKTVTLPDGSVVKVKLPEIMREAL